MKRKPQSKRSMERTARLKAVRERFRNERPTMEELVESGEYLPPVSQWDYLESQRIAFALRKAREETGMSLANAAESTGMDKSAISRLERGQYENVTINTLNRLLNAYGRRLVFSVQHL